MAWRCAHAPLVQREPFEKCQIVKLSDAKWLVSGFVKLTFLYPIDQVLGGHVVWINSKCNSGKLDSICITDQSKWGSSSMNADVHLLAAGQCLFARLPLDNYSWRCAWQFCKKCHLRDQIVKCFVIKETAAFYVTYSWLCAHVHSQCKPS